LSHRRPSRVALRAGGGGLTLARLPKTRSGKVLRDTIKKIADGESWAMPATIDDPVILDEIASALKGKGMGA
jgi:propionyl-CoA synthetase